MTVGIKDIARRAGVSRGTVDRVIHKRGHVTEHVRQKVENVILELGYKRNILASQLVANKSLQVAILLPHFTEDNYWRLPLNGIYQCQEDFNHLNISLHNHFYDLINPNSFEQMISKIDSEKYDALIMTPSFPESLEQVQTHFGKDKQSQIILDRSQTSSDQLPYHTISTDSYQAGRAIGRFIEWKSSEISTILALTIGKRKYGQSHIVAKQQGLIDYFANTNSKIQTLHIENTVNTSHLTNTVKEYIKLNGPFSSLCVCNEMVHRLDRLKQSIPQLFLIGFDLISENMSSLREGTVDLIIDQHPFQQGYMALKTILDTHIFEKKVENNRQIPFRIITQESLQAHLLSV